MGKASLPFGVCGFLYTFHRLQTVQFAGWWCTKDLNVISPSNKLSLEGHFDTSGLIKDKNQQHIRRGSDKLKEVKRNFSNTERDEIILMRREVKEAQSVLEAEKTNLSLSPHLGEGVMFLLRAEVEHLSSKLPPTDMSAPPPRRKRAPISRAPVSSPVCSQLPRWLHRPRAMPTHPKAHFKQLSLCTPSNTASVKTKNNILGALTAETPLELQPASKNLVLLKFSVHLNNGAYWSIQQYLKPLFI